MRKVQIVIFDLDGTLMNAYRAVYLSINYAMKKMGLPRIDAYTIKRNVGWGDRHLLETFVGKERLPKTLAIYRKHHKEALKNGGTKFLPGAKRLLQQLKKQKYRLAIASNRPTVYSHIALRELAIRQDFHYILCGDRVKRPKPYPDVLQQILKKFALRPSQALYVGDMILDVQTGKRARVKTVAVTTGSSTVRELSCLKPYKIIKNVYEVCSILDQLNSN